MSAWQIIAVVDAFPVGAYVLVMGLHSLLNRGAE